MFGTSGIRGPVGEEVTAALALDVGRALGVDRERVVLGRDPRESGRFLADALAAGLVETGTEVVDLGPAATPTVARAVDWWDAGEGVAVTASHNPPADNGLKLWQPGGQAADAERRETVAARVGGHDGGDPADAERPDGRDPTDALRPWDELGERWAPPRTGADSARRRHRDAIVEAVSVDDPPAVVVDVGTGAGQVTVDALAALGCAVTALNAQPDGAFPARPSEPTAENCEALATVVAESDAALGIAHDGDADRMRAVAHDGTVLSGDGTLAILAAATAAAGETVAVPVDTSLAVADALAARDVAVTRTPVGDVHVAAATRRADVSFGGEPSGAWIFPAATRCPDGPLAAARLVALAAERPLADRAADVPSYPIRRERIETDAKEQVLDAVRATVTDRYDGVSTLDGVRVDRDDGWFLVRASGTQPLVRLTAEAREPARSEDLLEEARALVAAARDGSADET
jgi:phosphoglucosamine mutase